MEGWETELKICFSSPYLKPPVIVILWKFLLKFPTEQAGLFHYCSSNFTSSLIHPPPFHFFAPLLLNTSQRSLLLSPLYPLHPSAIASLNIQLFICYPSHQKGRCYRLLPLQKGNAHPHTPSPQPSHSRACSFSLLFEQSSERKCISPLFNSHKWPVRRVELK